MLYKFLCYIASYRIVVVSNEGGIFRNCLYKCIVLHKTVEIRLLLRTAVGVQKLKRGRAVSETGVLGVGRGVDGTGIHAGGGSAA